MPRLLTNLDAANVGRITNLPLPQNDGDAATKQYVDAVARGLRIKPAVKAATISSISLSNPGNSIDGVALENGDRVLVKDQADPKENGIYVVQSNGALMRAPDFAAGTAVAGAYVFVDQGDINGDTSWVCVTNDPISLGTSDIVWSSFGREYTYTNGPGLGLAGNQFYIDESYRVQWLETTISGDGQTTDFVVFSGGAISSSATVVQVFDAQDELVIADVQVTSTQVSVRFSQAPAANETFRVVAFTRGA